MSLCETQPNINVDHIFDLYDAHVTSYVTFLVKRFCLTSVYIKALSQMTIPVLSVETTLVELSDPQPVDKYLHV